MLAPLVNELASAPTVFGISGYSGAGTKTGKEPKISPESLRGGVRPYALTDHIHEREASHHLSSLAPSPVSVAFTPVVAPWFQGIISTVSAPLKQEMRASDVRALFEERYKGEQLIKLVPGVPEVYEISGKHGVKIGGFQVHSSGKRVVAVVRPPRHLLTSNARSHRSRCLQGVLDNLLKGAATQCLQVSARLLHSHWNATHGQSRTSTWRSGWASTMAFHWTFRRVRNATIIREFAGWVVHERERELGRAATLFFWLGRGILRPCPLTLALCVWASYVSRGIVPPCVRARRSGRPAGKRWERKRAA